MDVVDRVVAFLESADRANVVAVSLVGSSVVGGRGPDSDVDLLVVVRTSVTADVRRSLTGFLLQHSGRRATVTPGPPLDVSVLALDDVVPWRYPPVRDLIYGEWLRDELTADPVPSRHVDPDVAVLVASARRDACPLLGRHPADLLDPVPVDDLRRAVRDSLDALLADLVGDERNVLLTLARMVVTVRTGDVVPKDQAAALVGPDLSAGPRRVLARAAAAYRGEAIDRWDEHQGQAAEAAAELGALVRAAGARG